MAESIDIVFAPVVDSIIDRFQKGDVWRSKFKTYELVARRFYNNILRFSLLSSIVFTGVITLFWNVTISMLTMSTLLIAILITLDPIWAVTSPETYPTFCTMKGSIALILDTVLGTVCVLIDACRRIFKDILTHEAPRVKVE